MQGKFCNSSLHAVHPIAYVTFPCFYLLDRVHRESQRIPEGSSDSVNICVPFCARLLDHRDKVIEMDIRGAISSFVLFVILDGHLSLAIS